MKQYTVIIAAGLAAIVLVAVVFGADIVKLSIPTQEYDIFVDPILDKQSLFVMGRVTIQNTGSQPLTNIHVNFGAGDTIDLRWRNTSNATNVAATDAKIIVRL